VKLNTTKFGELDVLEEKVIFFSEGLLGFPQVKRYALLDHYREAPFKWLQATDDPNLAFVVMDPLIFKPDFRLVIHVEELADLQAQDQADLAILVIITIPKGHPEKMTANLQGPLVMNVKTQKAKQLVLPDDLNYPCRYPLFPKGVSEERSMAGTSGR
jgi:flagellar assembly factor FliW